MEPSWIGPFFDALRKTGIVARACERAGVTSTTVYARRREDADFRAAWDDAMEDAVDMAEEEAWRRGVNGYEEPVVYQGQLTPVFERDEHGEILLREVDQVDANGKPFKAKVPVQKLDERGQPVYLTVRKHSDALLALILKGRRKRVFADRTELTGADGGPVGTVDETNKAARLAALLALAESRKRRAQQADDFSDLA